MFVGKQFAVLEDRLTLRSLMVIEMNDLMISPICLIASTESSRERLANVLRFSIQGLTYSTQAVFWGISALANPMVHSFKNSRVSCGARLASPRLMFRAKEMAFEGIMRPATSSVYTTSNEFSVSPLTFGMAGWRSKLKNLATSLTRLYAPSRRLSSVADKFRSAILSSVPGTSVGRKARSSDGVMRTRARADRIT